MQQQRGFLVFLFLTLSISVLAQKRDRLELKQADELIGRGKVRVLKGNVIFEQDGTLMYTDSAYFYPKENALDAFGNVRIVQPAGAVITSNKLFYNGDTKLAKFRGNVVLKDKNSTVYTESLDYDMANKTATYSSGATIIDPPNTLTSEYGFYNSATEIFEFKRNVKVVNPQDSMTVFSNHLLYNTGTKIATFLSPSTVIQKSDTIFAESGDYNTVSDQTQLVGSTIISGDYVLSGNQIDYNKRQDRGIITGNVRMVSELDEVVIIGEKAIHRGDLGFTKIFGNPVMIKENTGDTLFLTADTLVSIDRQKTTGEKKLLAYYNSKVFKEDLQAVADSLVYNFGDSTIYFYRNPVMWNLENQISADSIHIQLANDQIDKMFLKDNSFIISKDDLSNFNQIKGRSMQAYFLNDTIRRVDVQGNSESIYFVLEGDTALSGLNKVVSSNMKIFFEDNKVSTISFLVKPEGVFIPPQLIQEPDRRLQGFEWYTERRPIKSEVMKQKL